jgi:hypothetical protein
MLKRRIVVQAAVAGSLVAATAALAMVAHERLAPGPALGPADDAGWRPIAWPFPRDGWPAGRAWRREGTEVYVRPKLGFCANCETGVVTDDEVDRVADIDLLDERFAPAQEGRHIRIARLEGRARLYRYKLKNGGPRFAEGIAVSSKCDLIVAIVAGNVVDEQERRSAHRFLESSPVQAWLSQQLEAR